MIKCSGRIKLGYLRELRKTSKSFVVGGFGYDKDEHCQINIGFTAWGNAAEIISENATVGSVLIFHDALLKNVNLYDKNAKQDDNNMREIVINDYNLDEIQMYDSEATKKYITVWLSSEKQTPSHGQSKQQDILVEEKQESLIIDEDDFPY